MSKQFAKYGDGNDAGSLHYTLAHGTFIDTSIWKPKSYVWKYRIGLFRRVTKSDYFPSRVISEVCKMDYTFDDPHYNSLVGLRVEFVPRLKFIFIDDAIEQSREKYGEELTVRQVNFAIAKAKNNLAKYARELRFNLENDSPR